MKTDKTGNLFRMRALAAAIGFASGAVHAVDPVVTNLNDSGEGSLRQALLDASEDGGAPSVVTFQEGLSGTISLQSYLPTIFESIDIQGDSITVRGLASDESEGGVFRFQPESSEQSFALRGLTITGSGTSGVSAQLGYDDSSLLLQDVVITKNSGGGVNVRGGDLTIEDSVISGNKKQFGPDGRYGYGAGITFLDGGLTIQDSKVIDNVAGSNAGGIYAYDSEVSIERSVISGNTAGRRGGGVRVRGYEGIALSISDSTISGNVANDGAGIHAYSYQGGFLYIRNSSIKDNRAVEDSSEEGGRAGGIRFGTGRYNEGSFLLENSVVEGNSAESDGGLTIRSESATIVSSLIKGNTASDAHGAFRIDASNLTISQSTITDNSAPSKAVGDIDPLEYSGSEFSIDSTTISGNSSGEGSVLDISIGYEGGGVIANSTISGNTARDAVVEIKSYAYNAPGLDIVNSTFSGNRSIRAPSAIELDQVDFQIIHSTFVNNRAATSDGFATTAQLSILNSDSEGGVAGSLQRSVFTSDNDVEVQIGGNKFDFYEGSSSGGYVGASISNVIMTKNIAVDEGSASEGTPLVVDAGLAPLGYRGGFTLVHEPVAGSAAIDAGSEGSRPDNRDQRGVVGNFGEGGNSDLGAVEVVSNTPPRMIVNLAKQIDGVLGTEIPTFSVADLFVDDEGDNISVDSVVGLPTGLTFNEGSISGTLEVAGTFAVTAIVRDDNAVPLQTVEQFVVTIPEKKSSSSGSVPVGVLALFGFLAMLRRRRS